MKLSQLRKIIKESIKELVAEGSNCWAYAGAITGNEGCRQTSLLGNGSCPGFSSYEACCRNGAVDPLANRCTDNVRGPRGITPTDALTTRSAMEASIKQPLNEEPFIDCQTNWLNANAAGILNANTNSTTGEIDMQGYFEDALNGAIDACEHLIKIKTSKPLTKN